MFLGLVLVAGAAYVALAWSIGDKVPHSTSVEGVGIGGLTRTAAEQRLRNELAARSNQPIVLTWQNRTFRIDPGAAGLAIDYGATVQEAGGGFSLDPARIWHYFSGGDDIEAVTTVASSSMQTELAKLAAAVQQRPVEGAITFTGGQAHAVTAKPGRRLDLAATRELLVHEFLYGGRRQLPVVPDQPYVGEAAVQRAMHDFAQPAMSAPVVLLVGGQKVVARPQQYAVALSMVPDGHELKPVVDGQRLLDAIRPSMVNVGDKPRNARIRLVRGRPTVVPARIGATFDVQNLAERFPTYAAKPSGKRQMPVKAVIQQPDVTTADAERLGLDQVVAAAASSFPYAVGTNDAVAAVASQIDATLVRPGQALSVVAPTGGPTSGPGAFAPSQVASTLYAAAFTAGLGVLDHTPLPTYHPAFALGVDALLDADHPLRLKDDTPYAVMPVVEVQDARPGHPGSVTVRLWSTRYWDVTTRTGPRQGVSPSPVTYDDTPGCRPRTGSEGFTVAVQRTRRHQGQQDQETFRTSYHATPTVRCGTAPQPTPQPTPTSAWDQGASR